MQRADLCNVFAIDLLVARRTGHCRVDRIIDVRVRPRADPRPSRVGVRKGLRLEHTLRAIGIEMQRREPRLAAARLQERDRNMRLREHRRDRHCAWPSRLVLSCCANLLHAAATRSAGDRKLYGKAANLRAASTRIRKAMR